MDEPGSPLRRSVIWVMGVMLVVWIALYFFSFSDDRGQADPADFSFMQSSSSEGKKVFQAYNCMGCHTIVGNGAYFAPDLTDTYATVGPAWLAAYLPSAGTWPSDAVVAIRIRQMAEAGLIEADTPAAYYAAYPGAEERVRRRGGQAANMPDLNFDQDEINALIAFLHYTSSMHTEGWPPEIRARTNIVERRRNALHERAGVLPLMTPTAQASVASAGASITTADAAAPTDPAAQGEVLADSLGCLACHSTGSERRVGPGWGGLYGSRQKLVDGSTVEVDDAYLAAAISHPEEAIPEGYPAGVMPAYGEQIESGQIDALVAYIKSLAAGGE